MTCLTSPSAWQELTSGWPDTSVHARVPREPEQEQSAVTHAPWENWQWLHAGLLHIRGLSLTQEWPILSEVPVRPSSTRSRDGWMPQQQVGVSLTGKKFIEDPGDAPATVPASYRTAQRSRATGRVSNGNGTMITLASRRTVLTLGSVSRHPMAQSLNPQGKSGRWASCTSLLLEQSPADQCLTLSTCWIPEALYLQGQQQLPGVKLHLLWLNSP